MQPLKLTHNIHGFHRDRLFAAGMVSGVSLHAAQYVTVIVKGIINLPGVLKKI